MPTLIAAISIFAITLVVWLLNKISPFKICPICAGVAGTWGWMLVGIFTNQLPITNYQLPIGILMGGSVVGITYQLEKRLPAGRSPLLWKTLFIPAGFLAVYSLLAYLWIVFFVTIVFLAIFSTAFLKVRKQQGASVQSETAKELEKKMEQCC